MVRLSIEDCVDKELVLEEIVDLWLTHKIFCASQGIQTACQVLRCSIVFFVTI